MAIAEHKNPFTLLEKYWLFSNITKRLPSHEILQDSVNCAHRNISWL